MKRVLTSILAACILFGVSPLLAQEKENPIAEKVKAELQDRERPFTMIVIVKVKEGAGEKFETAFAKAIAGTRKEKGNIRYELNRAAKQDTRYLVYERWRNFAALDAHLKTPHITTLLTEIGDLLEAPPEVHVLIPASE
jgi:quinol monooxygenase YgiN